MGCYDTDLEKTMLFVSFQIFGASNYGIETLSVEDYKLLFGSHIYHTRLRVR
jgi:hypothetical protein